MRTTTPALSSTGRPIPNAAVMSVAVVPGSRALNLMSGCVLAYCTVNIVAAAFDAAYRASGIADSGRSGLLTAQNDPIRLDTVTTFGFDDLRNNGSAASVTRTTPTALVSNDLSAAGPSKPISKIPALCTNTSSRPSAASI